jgi:thiol-disulfide isomerase/thioredoxin
MKSARRALLLATLLTVTLAGPVQTAPADFALNDLDGKTVRLSDYRGAWVVINFWASWCPPCIRELPQLVEYQAANPEVRVIGINFEESTPAEARAFLEPFAVNFPNLKIGSTPLEPFEPLEGLPTTTIVSPAGEIVERHMGPVTAEHLEKLVRQHQQRH